MNTPARIALLSTLIGAPMVGAQPTDLVVDETQSTIFLEITLDTPVGSRTDDDIAPIGGSVTLELDDYDNPTTITIIDYSFNSGTLGYIFDFGILGSVFADATNLSLGLPDATPPVSGPVDPVGNFTIANVPNEVTGNVDITGTGTIGTLVGNTSVDLSTLAQDPISVSGTVNVAAQEVTLTIDFPLDGTGTDPDTGVTVTFSGNATLIATGPVPGDACIADVNGDGMLTPTDFTAWINAFNNNLPGCDQNGDGSCTPTDFTAWINNYNVGCN